MKGVELLPFLTKEQKELLETSYANYKRMARIYFEVLEFSNDAIVVKVWQMENPIKRYLSQKELVDRVRDVFNGDVVPENIKVHVRAIPFEKMELISFSIEKVNEKMEKLGLKPKDVARLLNLDKSSLSELLSGNRSLTKSHKAMFFYLFKYLELKGDSDS